MGKMFRLAAVVAIFSLSLSFWAAALAQEGFAPPPGSVGGDQGMFSSPQDFGSSQPMMGQQPMMGGQQPMFGQQPMMDQQPMFDQQPMMGQQPMSGPSSFSGFSSGATCNVEGVELPGSCVERRQMFGSEKGPGGEGMMGPGGGEQGMRMGPSEEEMEKMDKKREEMEKKQRARGLQQMKKGIKQMASGIKMIESRLAKLEKQNVPVPLEYREMIAKAKAAIEAVLAATDPEDVQEQMETLQEVGQSIGDMMPKLEMLARLPQMIKKAESEIKRVERSYSNMSKKAQRAKIDVSTILAKWQALIGELKAALAEAKAGQFGEGEDPMQIIGEGVFERLEETWRYNQTVGMVLDIKRNLKQVAVSLKKYEKRIAQLDKKGTDMSEAKDVLGELKARYQEVSEAVAGGLEPEAMEEFINDLDYYTQLEDQLETLLGLGGPVLFEQQMKAPVQGGSMKFKMPNFEKLMFKNLESEIAQNWQAAQEKLLSELQAEKIKKLRVLASLLKAAKAQVIDLTADGVSLPADLKEGILSTLAALGSPSAVAQK